ncbi:MAG TPA: DUF72 domain-containing protein [Gemmatimonadaceae bacterium]|jgi:uncharacterized protein YecE (DUF72 family)|nr:DUF72 domain-containing protein [Gemmatimonadaceae bacterium]
MLHTDNPHEFTPPEIHLGVAGWTIRREHADKFSKTGTHLQRYASVFNAVEINSCFYRPHRFSTYERWAASVPEVFRFAVKLPKIITHEARLVGPRSDLDRFLAETAGLGPKRGPILVQLPPSLAFEESVARSFFSGLRDRFDGDIVLEPRHETWFTPEVESILVNYRIARVAADPARVPAAAVPAGYDRLVYLRLHGSPRVYYSAYPSEELQRITGTLEEKADLGISSWCIFDNTALGAATADAFAVRSQLSVNQRAGK